MADIKTILSHFSFSEPEINIYLATLSFKSPSVSEIAKKAGLNRSAAYFHIKNLLEKGIIKETRSGKTLRFVAAPPAELSERYDQLLTDFKGLIPQLEALGTIESDKPVIEMTDSTTGYFKVYDQISSLPPGSTFRVIEGAEATRKEFELITDSEWNRFFHRVVDRQLETRAIFTEESLAIPDRILSSETAAIFKDRIWHLRTLPETVLPIKDLAFMYGNKVSILFPRSAFVLTITHQGIADVMAMMFDALFTFATPREAGWRNKK